MNIRTISGTARTGGVALAIFALLGVADAQLNLNDNNSSVYNDTPGGPLMTGWEVDGVDHLVALDYYYRIGSTGPEAQLNTIAPLMGSYSTDTNPFTDPGDDTAVMLYRTADFVEVELKLSLVGGLAGSGWSDVAHQVKISNTGSEALDFHLFEYADFDLGGSADNDLGGILSANKVTQSDGTGQVTLSEVITPDASHWDMAPYPSLLASLEDGAATVLTDSTGPVAGNVEFVLQWDVVLQPGDSFIVSKDMLIVPEPSSIALLGVISGLGVFIRRRFVG